MKTSIEITTDQMTILKGIGFLWSLPNTLLGLLVASLFLGKWQLWGTTMESRHRTGLLAALCSKIGISAFTLGNVVIYLTEPTPNLRAHEGRHTTQGYWLGPFFLPVYFVLMAFYGYRRHPMEVDARTYEYCVCGSLGTSKLN